MILTQILQPDSVKVPLEGKDKKSVITELVDLLDAKDLLLDRDLVLDAVLTREQTKSTGIGLGIAIPHGKCKAVKELVMSIGLTAEPVDFAASDGKGVTIVILLISPLDKTGPHIQALARISRMMLDEDFRTKLGSSKSAEDLYEMINQKENQ